MADEKTEDTLYCSFCSKSQHEVRKLIAGPKVNICNECVELCMDILVMPNDGMTEYPAERHAVVRRIRYEAGKIAEYRNPERIKLIIERETAKDYLAKIQKELGETSNMAITSDLSFQIQAAAKLIEELDEKIAGLPDGKVPPEGIMHVQV